MNEMFEYAQAFKVDGKELKELLLRNVDAIFDDEAKDWLRDKIIKYHV